MSHEMPYSDEQIDRYTEARVYHEVDLLSSGARYDLGHLVLTATQLEKAQAEMNDITPRIKRSFSVRQVDRLTPIERNQMTNHTLWGVLEKHPNVTDALGISPEYYGTGYIEFLLVGKAIEENSNYYRHAITMSLKGNYIGISNKEISGDMHPLSRASDIAMMDVRLSEGRSTERFSGSGDRSNQYGSRETDPEEYVYILNALKALGADDGGTESTTTSRTKAIYRKVER